MHATDTTGRIHPETLPALVDPARIAALITANPAGTARLLADVAAVGAPPARRRARLVAGGLAAVALTLGAGAPSASAAVIPLTARPLVLTVAGPDVRVDLDVVATAADARYGHGVVAQLGRAVLVGTAGSPLVHVSGLVPAAALTPGTSTGSLTDVGDGVVTPLAVTVLRASRVTWTAALRLPGGVLVAGQARHYDLGSGTYRGDQASTVAVQARAGRRWVTVAAAATACDGRVLAFVPATGPVTLRLVRAPGANVTGGMSTARTVR